ncbi:hypothetical protein TRVL_05598 [Trypanosoma vivax]|nr:hypothetical protein TRVL_05598 [Trypanosoma vivax]
MGNSCLCSLDHTATKDVHNPQVPLIDLPASLLFANEVRRNSITGTAEGAPSDEVLSHFLLSSLDTERWVRQDDVVRLLLSAGDTTSPYQDGEGDGFFATYFRSAAFQRRRRYAESSGLGILAKVK